MMKHDESIPQWVFRQGVVTALVDTMDRMLSLYGLTISHTQLNSMCSLTTSLRGTSKLGQLFEAVDNYYALCEGVLKEFVWTILQPFSIAMIRVATLNFMWNSLYLQFFLCFFLCAKMRLVYFLNSLHHLLNHNLNLKIIHFPCLVQIPCVFRIFIKFFKFPVFFPVWKNW